MPTETYIGVSISTKGINMRTGILGLALSIAIAIGSTGCADVISSEVSPGAIYSSYSANYDEASHVIHFSAIFTVGGELGTYVQLDSHSSITLDQVPMSMDRNILDQIVYDYDLPASPQALTQTHTFLYVDDSGNAYQNTVTLPATVTFGAGQSLSASIRSGFTIYWNSTEPVGDYDQLRAEFQGQNTIESLSATGGGAAGDIVVVSSELQNLGLGSASVQFCRSNSTGAIRGTAEGGQISVSSCGTPLSIAIVP